MQKTERNPLSKAVALLRWMTEEQVEAVGVRTAANALGVAPSSAHRLIASLVEEGLLQKDMESGRYMFGLELLRLAHKATEMMPLRAIALPRMRHLVDACGEAAFLAVYNRERQEIVTVAGVESSHTLRYVVDLYKWKPVYVSAAGWAIMAFLSDAERESIITRTNLAPVTERSITEPYRLERELAGVRDRGYALTHGQRIRGAVGFAAPIFNPSGAVFAGIGLSMPEQRFDPSNEAALAGLLFECASRITTETGGQTPMRKGWPNQSRETTTNDDPLQAVAAK